MLITEIGFTVFACIYLCFYAADTMYWWYENEIEKKTKEEEEKNNEEDEKIRKQIAKTLYS